MIINKEPKIDMSTMLCHLSTGSVFEYLGGIYIVVNDDDIDLPNIVGERYVVDLSSGKLISLDEYIKVNELIECDDYEFTVRIF